MSSNSFALRRGQASLDEVKFLFEAPVKMALSANVNERRVAVAEASQRLLSILRVIAGRPTARLGTLIRAHGAIAKDSRVGAALEIRNRTIHRLDELILEDPVGDDALSAAEAVAAVEAFRHGAVRVLEVPLSPAERAALTVRLDEEESQDADGGISFANFIKAARQAREPKDLSPAISCAIESDWYEDPTAERLLREARDKLDRRGWVRDYAASKGLSLNEVLSVVLREKMREADLTVDDVDVACETIDKVRAHLAELRKHADRHGITLEQARDTVSKRRVEDLVIADIAAASLAIRLRGVSDTLPEALVVRPGQQLRFWLLLAIGFAIVGVAFVAVR